MATRAAYFSLSEAQILMEAYEEVKDIIKKKGNTATVIKQREKAWQSIADRLNALNMNGPKRTWQQVKIKYKNILQNAVKKNAHRQGTGGGSPKADLTPAEDMALELNKGRPVLEGIPGGKETSIGSSQDATRFIQVSGSTVFLLEPPAQAPDDADPGEGPSAAATAHDEDDDEEETISLDSRRHESSQAIRKLYGNHLRHQIELADIDIQYKKKKMENLALESEIKKRTIRKLDLEIKKLEREVRDAFNVHCMLTVTHVLIIIFLSSPSSKKMTQLKIKISNQYNQVIVIRHRPLLPTPPAPGVATSLYEGPKLCVPFCSDKGMPIRARCGG
ncbi:uncharacterized protein LOC129822926 isoform X2 [Salvelinus fontinalis]|uniref:uncharacterized protein LOC129822926 isoform X2 n=1 Tax=Salvelinus fontinalis TaxID=8038 RepID=UPI002484DF17|nr:uncharacterized protein LOC129822926 isoform X2 [Salvelinus fontinalis]